MQQVTLVPAWAIPTEWHSTGFNNTAPAASRKAPKATSAAFVVSSECGYPSDGWHSDESPTRKTDSVHKTVAAANKRARMLFYKENPWGLSKARAVPS